MRRKRGEGRNTSKQIRRKPGGGKKGRERREGGNRLKGQKTIGIDQNSKAVTLVFDRGLKSL